MIYHIKNIGSLNRPKPPKTTLQRTWRASSARLSRYRVHAAPPPRRLPIAPKAIWAIGCWPCCASLLRLANNAQASNGPGKLTRQPIGLAMPMLPNRPNGRARARAVLPVAAGMMRGAISARCCLRLLLPAAAVACGCCRPGAAPPGAGAGAPVTVTGTTRKQFFDYSASANNFLQNFFIKSQHSLSQPCPRNPRHLLWCHDLLLPAVRA